MKLTSTELSVEGNKLPHDSFLYDGKKGRRIGTIKTNIWSPILKANLSMADIEYTKGVVPKEIWAEIYYQKELEWRATWARCTVSEGPFWVHHDDYRHHRTGIKNTISPDPW